MKGDLLTLHQKKREQKVRDTYIKFQQHGEKSTGAMQTYYSKEKGKKQNHNIKKGNNPVENPIQEIICQKKMP